jgi:trimethylamine--corrinoid protein Co-methyltransferase
MVFGNFLSSPNSLNLDRGKQPGNFENFKDFMKLTRFFNCIHFAGGYTVEPRDINPS